MRTTRIFLAIMSAVVLLPACGSSKPKAADTTTTTTSTAAPTTTAAATTTTPLATPTTPAPTTTAATTTTTPVVIDQVAAVKQAILDFDSVRLACLADPATCDPAIFATGPQLEAEREFAAMAVRRKAYVRTRDDDPSYSVFESVVVATDMRSAVVQSCRWDTSILESPGPVIINDERVSFHLTVSLVFEGDKWRVARQDQLSYLAGVNDCGRPT
jgi:hypothetical protein